MNLANSHGFSYVYKIHIIFSYTTPLFYAMHEVRMNFFFFR